ncbi:flagellar assembly factor FliW [Tistlia consotensis]|uniref:Flagellar assembly factor FliW n=1 Tax=Tistlia consotensis USBA 355 TaxID=560819 RepID=A0A1Y6CIG1_9PROT|nr:flagellar assembly protein FliW [Tistlia consotensis]SMF67833.1 flagellar assembly factor FliW [Tistlia consotensis USBA 355]SNR99473.1 flagellar assembly factor FliW [Tistlia consotensis]
MPATQALLAETAMPTIAETVVETRFGVYAFDDSSTLVFPHGLLGFAGRQSFGLGNLPQPELAAYKLLQSLERPELSFIVTPLEPDSGLVAKADLEAACRGAGVAFPRATFLLMVTLRPGPDGLEMTANLRAPLVLDLERHLGRQIVLQNPDYPIRHSLAG